jgi:RHS repeat-associated protein
MAARLTHLFVVLGLLLGTALPSAVAAVFRPPTSQGIAASPVPARGFDLVYARSYFGARYYRADRGRFTTIDPAMTMKDNVLEPQRWNRYAYVTNNPLKYTDPDGKNPLLIAGGVGAAVYGGWGIYQDVSHGQPCYNNVGVEATKGLMVGLTLGLAAPALAAADVGVGTATAALDAAAASRVASTALRFDPSTIFNDARKVEHMFKEVHQLELLGTRTEALSKIVDATQKAYSTGALSMDKTGVIGQYLLVAGQKVFVQGRVIGDTLRIGHAWIPKI